jgi:hypothetical protein
MRTENAQNNTVEVSLNELDALVGERVMGDAPAIYWEDSYANQRFDSLEEALDAMADAVLSEVREFPRYSSETATALEIVERFSAAGEALHLRQKQEWWIASFGSHPECRSHAAAAAICLAALRVKGVHVELRDPARAAASAAR